MNNWFYNIKILKKKKSLKISHKWRLFDLSSINQWFDLFSINLRFFVHFFMVPFIYNLVPFLGTSSYFFISWSTVISFIKTSLVITLLYVELPFPSFPIALTISPISPISSSSLCIQSTSCTLVLWLCTMCW